MEIDKSRAKGSEGKTYAERRRGGACEQEVRGKKVTMCHVKRWREVERGKRERESRRLFYQSFLTCFGQCRLLGTEKLAAFILNFPMEADKLTL